MHYPLSGTLILDISRVIAGPACSMHLADMGAEVIKIEPPEGDKTRLQFPYSERIPEGRLYLPFNRSPVQKINEVFNDPEIEKLRMVREVVHPLYGTMKTPGIPFEFPETPLEVRLPPPPKGGHTNEILKEHFQLTDQEMGCLRTQGIID
jgi:crotonobetainyl-CoA:carnitine CoA-transferase CaiB-like acyl-CoA transferase